jgi:hypothetical protein
MEFSIRSPGADSGQVDLSPEKIIDLGIEAALQVEDEVLLCSILAVRSFHAAQP